MNDTEIETVTAAYIEYLTYFLSIETLVIMGRYMGQINITLRVQVSLI